MVAVVFFPRQNVKVRVTLPAGLSVFLRLMFATSVVFTRGGAIALLL